MHIEGTILDYDTHEPISGVLMMLHGEDGAPLGLQTMTDFKGRFDWEEPQMMSIEKVKISQVGYVTETYLVSDLKEGGQIYLKERNDFTEKKEKEVVQETEMPQETLDIGRTITEDVVETTVIAPTKERFNFVPYLLVGGVGLAAYLFLKAKK